MRRAFLSRDSALSSQPVTVGALGVVFFIGAVLRFGNLDWASPYYFQPDENVYTVDYVLQLPPSLNPYEVNAYTYGGLPLYLYYFTSRGLARLTQDPLWLDEWHVTQIARTYAATAGTLTIVLVYLFWQLLNGSRLAGLISAAAFATSPLPIQYAHYGVVDTMLVFWAAATTVLVLLAYRQRRAVLWLVAGLALGFATASKATGSLWALAFVAAAIASWVQARQWRSALLILVLGGIGSFAGVLIGSPYYLLDWPAFLRTMQMQNAITVTGDLLMSYHWQFLQVMPVVYELRQLALWAIGIPFTVLGLVGLVWLWRDALLKHVEWLIVLVAPTAYLGMIVLWQSKFIRYLLPAIPFICFAAAQPLWAGLHSRFKVVRWVSYALAVGAVVFSAFFGFAISNVYAGPDPRIAASEWMLANIPPSANILRDPEPNITLPLGDAGRFQIRTLDLYGNRFQSMNDVNWFAQNLAGADYNVIVSRRNYGTILRLAGLFPTAACYYSSIFDGTLGYREVATFSNYPRVGPWVWNTDAAEETFQVFDHPTVRIFKREVVLTVEQSTQVLNRCLAR